MAPATAAAARAPVRGVPSWSTAAGATSTTRSELSCPARAVSSSTLSPAPPATTAMRSIRAAEAASTLSRRACCTEASVLSHTTTPTFS